MELQEIMEILYIVGFLAYIISIERTFKNKLIEKMSNKKFKAIEVDACEWVYGNFIKYKGEQAFIQNGSETIEIYPDSVCENIGIQSKNGEYIFRNDKLSTYNGWGYVIKTENGYAVELIMDGRINDSIYLLKGGAIIGNRLK